MFWNLFKYKIKILLKVKVIVFWSFIYPLLLGTLFYVAFGAKMGSDDKFETIPVAVVYEQENYANDIVKEAVDEAEYDDETAMFMATYVSADEAEGLLTDGEVKGIITLDEDIQLTVAGAGMSETVLKVFTDTIQRKIGLYEDAAKTDYTKIEAIDEMLKETNEYINHVSLGGESLSSDIQFFFGLIAMTCLFGSFVGISLGNDIQANASPNGARKNVSATNRVVMILSDLLAAVLIEFIGIVMVCSYLRFVLQMPIGDKYGYMLLTLFLGTLLGIEIGQFISCFARGNEGAKIGISLAFNLTSSALSGLMSKDIKFVVDRFAPFLSKINPGTVITNCFYCIGVYQDSKRLMSYLTILAVEVLLLFVGSFLAMRRCKYVSV